MLAGKSKSVLPSLATMISRLPLLYAFAVLVELVALTWIFLNDPPAPSAPLSIGLGWAGLGSMIIMLVYIFARRSRALRRMAPLSAWLNFHIFMGVQGVVFVFFHSVHVFQRDWEVYWSNPAILNFFAVMIVFSSGIFGRYLYAMLPKTVQGERMALADVQRELRGMAHRMPAEIAELLNVGQPSKSFAGVVGADLNRRAALRTIGRHDLDNDVLRVAKRRLNLESRLAIMAEAHRFFRWWIILHRPLSAVMYILSILHVVLTYMFAPSLASS